MIQRYFDATYLGKLHWLEPGSQEVTACAIAADELVCALHGGAEFYSIGHRKIRESLATPATVRAVFIQFQTDCGAGQIRLLPLTESILQRVEADSPIIVQDDGSGMKTAELEVEYLNIVSRRFSRKGERTPNLKRLVKGRKGIGKFAGLILASEMEVITHACSLEPSPLPFHSQSS